MSPPQNQSSELRDRVLRSAENVIYLTVTLLLILGALALLGKAGYDLVTTAGDGLKEAVRSTLDTLLFVFILVELMGAVKVTLEERKLLGEPFLLVGIIASIKEIVVLTIEVKSGDAPTGAEFEQAMIEIGVLAGVVVALSLATLLLRRKEREPKE